MVVCIYSGCNLIVMFQYFLKWYFIYFKKNGIDSKLEVLGSTLRFFIELKKVIK